MPAAAAAKEEMLASPSAEQIFSLAAGVAAALETHAHANAARDEKSHQGIFSKNRTPRVSSTWGKWSGTHQDRSLAWSETVLGPTIYLYDGPNLAEEVDNGGNILARYTQGAGVDRPLAESRSGVTSYYEQDGLGSVSSLSNSVASLANTYTYDSHGKLTASTGTLTNPFQYTGREFDPETGIYEYRARYYDPTNGRFIGEDPMRFGGAVNFYAYVHNNSVNLTDPFGLRACKEATKNCIQRGLESLFPGVTASVGDSTGEVGGHWNFNVQLQFSSYDAAMGFYNSYWGPTGSARNGFNPPARFGNGPAVHLENLSPTSTWLNNDGTYTVDGTAHVDLFNPDNEDVESVGGHVGVDGLIGHIVQALGGNIDPANCPW